MSHEVLGDLFFQTRQQPAWHGIMHEGIDPNREYTAAEVYALFGKVDVRLAGLQTVGARPDGSHLAIPHKAIVRGPIDADPNPAIFGVVSDDYVLVSPEEIVELWDAETRRKVQTMMFLREGKLMVICAKLPGFAVRGEDVSSYVQIGNWMDGANASTALVSRVCTVCMNTWQIANSKGNALESYRFSHDQHIKYRMGEWFKQVLARAESSMPVAMEMMEALARTKIGTTPDEAQANVKTVLHAAYPTPKAPREDPLDPREVIEKRTVKYEYDCKVTDERRVTALDLFRGAGTGMSLPSRKGTLWGLYQAVCEVEDYRKGARADGLAASILFGDRGQTKDRAFVASLEVAAS